MISEKLKNAALGAKKLTQNAVALYVGKSSILFKCEKSYISEDKSICPYILGEEIMVPVDFFLNSIGKSGEDSTAIKTKEEKNSVIYGSLKELCETYGKFLHTEINGLAIYSDEDIEEKLDWQNNTDVMRNICESFMFEDISGKDLAALIEKNHPDKHHPRLLLTQEKIDSIKKELSKTNPDKVYVKILENMKVYAEKYMNERSSGYEIRDGIRLLDVCRENACRMFTLALMYLITGEERYAKRAYLEMYNSACFVDWNPYHFLDVGELTASLGICYDWLYNWMDDYERLYIRQAIFKNGIMPIMDDFDNKERKRSWNWRGDLADNWRLVIAGVGVGAMSIVDELSEEERPFAERAMEQTLFDIRRALSLFAPYGGYEEGFTYWRYAMKYFTFTVESLKNASGSYFGYLDIPGMKLTNQFMLAVNGSVSAFTYHDCERPGVGIPPQMMYLAERFGKYEEAKPRIECILSGELPDMHDVYNDMLWYNPEMLNSDIKNQISDVYMPIAEIATMRNGWSKDDMYVGFHCDDPIGGEGHDHMDSGTFVMDALGETFFVDLGADNYDVTDYYNTYRVRPEGHNVLVFNPDERYGQKFGGTAKITRCEFGGKTSYAIGQLSDAYDDDIGITSYERGVKIFKNKNTVVVQDEVTLEKGAEIWWFAHTESDVEIARDGKSAKLTQNGKTIKATLDSNCDAAFTVMDAVLLPKSPFVEGQRTNEGTRKLAIHFENVSELNLTVAFSPLDSDNTNAKFEPIKDWKCE